MRLLLKIVLAVGLVLAVAGCGGGGTDRTPSPSAPSTGPAIDSVPAFQTFSGLTIPPTAKNVELRTTVDADGAPTYRVSFTLPSAELDAFCQDGRMNRPLRVTTIPADFRHTFGYQGDSSTGVAIAEASLPSDISVQRKVFAVGTKKTTAAVSIFADRMPN